MAELDGDVRNSPVAWFAELEMALYRGDLDAAAAACRELERLGISVKYRTKPRAARKGRGNDNH